MENIFIADTTYRETWSNEHELSDGSERFLNAYIQMQTERMDQSQITTRYFNHLAHQTEHLYKRILNPEKSQYKIPKVGMSIEVLTYMALREHNIPITYASFQDDIENQIDFFITDEPFPVDITCLNDDENFKKKYVRGISPVLFIPYSDCESCRPFKHSKPIPVRLSYLYGLIVEDTFDTEDFLYKTLDTNLEIMHHISNSNGRKFNKRFLTYQELFLNEFEKSIDTI